MRPSRKILRLISGSLIALLLFTQGAFAAQPCMDPGMSAASAMAEPGAEDCCDGPSVIETHLCAAACKDRNKLPGAGDPVSVPARIDVVLRVLPAPVPAARFAACEWRSPPRTAALPKSVLFCSFII